MVLGGWGVGEEGGGCWQSCTARNAYSKGPARARELGMQCAIDEEIKKG